MQPPRFKTEIEVTQALARREVDGVAALEYYREAKKYQAYLKTIQPRFFRRPSGKRIDWLNNRPGYATKRDWS
jgi:hypothetical protein